MIVTLATSSMPGHSQSIIAVVDDQTLAVTEIYEESKADDPREVGMKHAGGEVVYPEKEVKQIAGIRLDAKGDAPKEKVRDVSQKGWVAYKDEEGSLVVPFSLNAPIKYG